MAKGYWIVSIDVHQPERYHEYIDAAAPAYQKYGAVIIVRGGDFECPEGTCFARNVVVEFPSYQQALACYHSEEYQRAATIRQSIAKANFLIIEGPPS